jgi:hypothetical protein
MDNTLKELINAAHCHPSADNSQPFSYRIHENGFSAFYDAERVSDLTFEPENPAIQIALGALVWNVEQRAAEIGVNVSCSITGSPLEAIFTVEGVSNTDLSTPSIVYKRCTNRASFQSPNMDELRQLEELFADKGGVIVSGDSKASWVKLTQQASSIRFQVKEIHELLSKALTFAADSEKGLTPKSLGLPAGSGPMVRWISDWKNLSRMNRIGAYKLLAKEEVKLLAKPSVLGILYTTDEDYVEAGKKLCELWSSINALGLSVHPYYVITDITYRYNKGTLPDQFDVAAKEVQKAYQGLLTPRAVPIIMLRIGKAKKQLERSRRYPIEKLIRL